MAKDKKETKPAAEAAESKDIVDQIKDENKFEDENVKAAKEQIQKEKDEKKRNELMNIMQMADYVNKRELLELRKRRKEEAATKDALTESKKLLDDIMTGKLTPTEYKKKLKEVDKKKGETFDQIERENNEHIKELRDNYPTYYSFEWEYERRRYNW